MDLIKKFAIPALAVIAFLLSVTMYMKPSGTSGGSGPVASRLVRALADDTAEHQRLIAELSAPAFAESGRGILESYLVKIRKDGVPAHSDMRIKLDMLAQNMQGLLKLIDLYEPVARNAPFKVEADKFRKYAVVWLDRWNSMTEYLMAGGNYPVGQVAFPPGFTDAVKAEAQSVL